VTFALHIINWLVFITVAESVYFAVQTDSLYKADYVLDLTVSSCNGTAGVVECVRVF
jgi:hypothetical protein